MNCSNGSKSSNTKRHSPNVDRQCKERKNGHKSVILWFTGISGAGKSTLAHAVEERLYQLGHHTFVLDGDNVRHGLCGDLGFSMSDRSENIRRIGEVAKLFLEAGTITLTAFISPCREDRDWVRSIVLQEDFLEIYCSCSLDVCESRDVKGLYKKARIGEIKEFTGISSPYEEPIEPELVLDTGKLSLDACVNTVLKLLEHRKIINISI